MALISDFPTRLVNGGRYYVNISAGQQLSNVLNLGGASVLGFLIPTNFTSATLGFLSSLDGQSFFNLKDGYSGNPITVTAVPQDYSRVLPADFVGVGMIQLRSSIPQTNAVLIEIVCGPVL